MAAFAGTAAAHGAAVVIDLDPTGPSVQAIAAGRQDGYLSAFASAVRAFGGPVVISFGHEMNGNWYPWGWTHTRPAVFVAAWRRIVTVFRKAGAGNVTWLWTVNVVSAGGPAIRQWWPGSSYVTWAGIDGYLAEQGLNFRDTFAPTVAAIRGITAKPILISETAVGRAGQAAGIPGLFAGVARRHLLGLIWFDEAQKRRHLRPGLAARRPPGRRGSLPPCGQAVPRGAAAIGVPSGSVAQGKSCAIWAPESARPGAGPY